MVNTLTLLSVAAYPRGKHKPAPAQGSGAHDLHCNQNPYQIGLWLKFRLNCVSNSVFFAFCIPHTRTNPNSVTMPAKTSENQRKLLSGDHGAFQNASARTRADANAAHMRKAPGIMQMRHTTQMQIDQDACIRN